MFPRPLHALTPNGSLGAALLLVVIWLPASAVGAAVIVVDTELDDSSDAELCDLRDAIRATNDDAPVDGCPAGSSTSVDRIEFAAEVRSILLTSDLPWVDGDVHIVGPGPDRLLIDGDDSYHPLRVFPETEFVLSGITLFQGQHDHLGGCLEVAGDAETTIVDVKVDSCQAGVAGGGISLAQTDALLERVTVVNNRAPKGGGLSFIVSTVELRDSSILFNRVENAVEANDGWGGGMAILGDNDVVVDQTTIWGNEAPEGGSAVSLFSANSSLAIVSSTLVANVAGADGLGGALHVNGAVTVIYNTIVADNVHEPEDQPQPDVLLDSQGSIFSAGLNFIGSNAGAQSAFVEGFPNAASDWVGSEYDPLDAGLEPLGDHGGPTRTAPPTPGSLVVDRGSCSGTAADQRGWSNPDNQGRSVDGNPSVSVVDDCDVGAVELGAQSPVLFADGFESGDATAWQ